VKGAAADFVVGLGVRAVRAGTIGRDGQRLEENPKTPMPEAGGLGPRAVDEEISALYNSKRIVRAPRPGHLLVFMPELNPQRLPTLH
jgi:hypothetical protein